METEERKEEKTILLSFDEVRILLYSLGYTSCEGIHMPEKDFSPEEVVRSLHALYKRGLLLPDREEEKQKTGQAGPPRFAIREELLQMLRAMGNPGGTLIYRQGETLPGFSPEGRCGREFFCYIVPGYMLITERDWTRREYLRLRSIDPRDFPEWKNEREREAEEEEYGLVLPDPVQKPEREQKLEQKQKQEQDLSLGEILL